MSMLPKQSSLAIRQLQKTVKTTPSLTVKRTSHWNAGRLVLSSFHLEEKRNLHTSTPSGKKFDIFRLALSSYHLEERDSTRNVEIG